MAEFTGAETLNNTDMQDIMITGGSLEGMQGMEWLMSLLLWAGMAMNIIYIIFFLLKAWGLYNINKKLGEPYPWLAWIPLAQMYSFVKAGGKSGIWVLWIILGFIAFAIPGIILVINVLHNTSKRTGRGIWTTLGLLFFGFIMYPVVGYKLKDQSAQTATATESTQTSTEEL